MGAYRDKMRGKSEGGVEPRDYRKELWIKVASEVAGSFGANKPFIPAAWANAALDEFDKRFETGV